MPATKVATKKRPAAKRSAPRKAAAAAAPKPGAHQAFMKAELARLKKSHNYVSGSTSNKTEWSAIFKQACTNWSHKNKK